MSMSRCEIKEDMFLAFVHVDCAVLRNPCNIASCIEATRFKALASVSPQSSEPCRCLEFFAFARSYVQLRQMSLSRAPAHRKTRGARTALAVWGVHGYS